MKAVKIVGIVVGGLVGLVLIGALVILLVVNPNDFKPRIATAVKNSTGRDLNLSGDIKLSVFPWVALTLGPASLGNPPGFGDAPFLTINSARVRVRLLPLLSKRLEVGKVALDGLDLRLVKRPDGQSNWQMKSAGEATAPPAAGTGGAPSLASIGGIAVTHGRVSYNQYVIEDLDFETGAIASNQAVPVSLTLKASRGVAGESIALDGKLQVQANLDTEAIHVESLALNGSVGRAAGAPLQYGISAPQLDADLTRQSVSLPHFSLTLGTAKVDGTLSGTGLTGDMKFTGTVALAPLAVKDFAGNLGITLPRTRDARALSSLAASGSFGYDAAGIALNDLKVMLDDTHLQGNVTVGMGETRSVKFRLSADRIDLDRYRSPVNAPAEPASEPKPDASRDESPPLQAQGSFALGAARAAGIDFTNLTVTVDMKDKITHLHPLEAQLYGGRYSGDLQYDARAATPRISMDEHLAGVDVAQLVADTRAKGRVSGKANIEIKATARGAGADDILKSLNGHCAASLTNGAIEGLDVGYELALAQALLNKQTSTTTANTHKTAFQAFSASAQIADGIATTRDLAISTAVLKVAGQGTINLPTSAVDMTLLTSVLKTSGATAVQVPLKVTGTYTSPSVKPDLTGLVKEQIKQKAEDLLKKNGLDLNRLFKRP